MVSGNAVKSAQMTLGLIPEILNAINVIPAIRKPCFMVNPIVLEVRNIQHITGAESVGVHDAVGHNFLLHNGLQGGAFHIADHPGIYLAATL